jgi:hypothetical protein
MQPEAKVSIVQRATGWLATLRCILLQLASCMSTSSQQWEKVPGLTVVVAVDCAWLERRL